MDTILPAICRLKKRRDFLNIANKGNKAVASTLVVQGHNPLSSFASGQSEEACSIHVGFTVTKKVGNAVVRNRIRRRLRAAVDALLAETGKPGWEYVIIGRHKALDEPFPIILRDLRYAVRKVAKSSVAQEKK